MHVKMVKGVLRITDIANLRPQALNQSLIQRLNRGLLQTKEVEGNFFIQPHPRTPWLCFRPATETNIDAIILPLRDVLIQGLTRQEVVYQSGKREAVIDGRGIHWTRRDGNIVYMGPDDFEGVLID